jgi:hypothetical protein
LTKENFEKFVLTEKKDISTQLEAQRRHYFFWLFSVGWQKV